MLAHMAPTSVVFRRILRCEDEAPQLKDAAIFINIIISTTSRVLTRSIKRRDFSQKETS